jgi:hypothetical protein
MRIITVHNLSLQFDADQIMHGPPKDQINNAIDLINLSLQREPYGLGAQIIRNGEETHDILESGDIEYL